MRQILLMVAIRARNGVYIRMIVTGEPCTVVEIELDP